MQLQTDQRQHIAIGISLVLGVVLGMAQNPTINLIAFYCIEAFINLLKFISLPIIFLSITSAIAKLEDEGAFKNILGRTVFYTLLTTIIAAFVAMVVYLMINPALVGTVVAGGTAPQATDIGRYLLNMIPSNFVKIFADNNVMAITTSAILIGIASLFIDDEHKKAVHGAFESFFALFMKVAQFIAQLVPFVLWAFITIFVRDVKAGFELESLLYYVATIAIANVVQAVVVLPLFLKFKGISAIKTFKGMIPALVTAFFSKSSSATMPSTLQCMDKNLKVSKKVSSITIPLCTTINMNACAAFIYITVLFVAQSNGVAFSMMDHLSWIFLATIAAVGNAGVPMGCFFMASAYLASIGVSTYLMGVILPFYAILDMFETAINVWSDACVTCVVDKEQK